MEFDTYVPGEQILKILREESYKIELLDSNSYQIFSAGVIRSEKKVFIEYQIGKTLEFFVRTGGGKLILYNYRNGKAFDIAIPDKNLIDLLNYTLRPWDFFENLDFVLVEYFNGKNAVYASYLGEPMRNGAFSENFSDSIFNEAHVISEIIGEIIELAPVPTFGEGALSLDLMEVAALNGNKDAEYILSNSMGRIDELTYFNGSINWNEEFLIRDGKLFLSKAYDDSTFVVRILNFEIFLPTKYFWSTDIKEYPLEKIEALKNMMEMYFLPEVAE